MLTNHNISEEHREINAEIFEIQNLEGFNKLSEYQKRLIQASLYIQARAERGTDYASQVAIVSPDRYPVEVTSIHDERHLEFMHGRNFGPDPKERKYRLSQNAIANWYCHAAIAGLEYEEGLSVDPAEVPEDFFRADYYRVNSIQDVENIIDDSHYPSVVHIMGSEPANYNEGYNTAHSFLALGKNEEGKVIVWEKKGNKLPFRIVALDDLYAQYGSNHLWGARPLKNTNTKETTNAVAKIQPSPNP